MAEWSEEAASLRAELADLGRTVAALEYEVGGAPKVAMRGSRKSMRDRLHDLETDREAARAARVALEAATTIRQAAWTRGEKVALFVFAAVAAGASLLRLFGFGG